MRSFALFTRHPKPDTPPMIDLQDGALHLGSFLAVPLGIIILFIGKRLNEAFAPLREFSNATGSGLTCNGGVLVALDGAAHRHPADAEVLGNSLHAVRAATA